VTQGADGRIAARFSDFYGRQIAWLRESISALDAMLAETGEPDYDRWTAEDTARARRLDDLVAEFNALKKEWDAVKTVSAGDRAAVESLAREVAALRGEFQARSAKMTERLARSLDALRGEAGDLRRGRENARKYGTDGDPGGAIVDRRA